MPALSYIVIPREEYESLLREVQRGVEVCGEVSDLRLVLQSVVGRLHTRLDKLALSELRRGVAGCEDVARLRIELAALERRLREFDQELTPIRPPSRTDIKQAFDNSVEFAAGRKKVPTTDGSGSGSR